MLPFVSLDATTSTGAGAVRDLEGLFSQHTMQVHVTGTSGSVTIDVRMEGSHDGIAWAPLNGSQVSATDGLATVATHLVRYVRATVLALSGGTPVVTATIASKE